MLQDMGAQGICIEAQGLRRGYVVLGYNGSIKKHPPQKPPPPKPDTIFWINCYFMLLLERSRAVFYREV